MTTANKLGNNLSLWQPSQSNNPSGRPKGTRDLAGYVLETTNGSKELVGALVCIGKCVMLNVALREGSRHKKDQQLKPANQLKAIEILLSHGGTKRPRGTFLTRYCRCLLRTLGNFRIVMV